MRIPVKLDAIPIRETLRYLGWRGEAVDDCLRGQILSAQEEIVNSVEPCAVARLFAVRPGGEFEGTTFCAQGEDVRRLLSGCDRAALMAATLGAGSERMLLRAQAVDPARALILDAALSAAIESVCDQVSAYLQAREDGRFCTARFSPGYGDMPMRQTKEILDVLDSARQIGLTVSSSGVMIPRKSVCAVVGIGARRDTPHGCENCRMKGRCTMKKDHGRACAAEGMHEDEGNHNS